MSLAAHGWTVWPLVRGVIRPPSAPPAEEWSTEVPDARWGRVRLSGLETAGEPGSALLILVHGLGGSAESRYLIRAARTAAELGCASLRLNLRGADGRGEDFYHAGLSADLAAVLASPSLDAWPSFLVLGYSLGGHVVLKLATEVEDPRLRAVAAVCSPLDLERTVAAFDRPARWPYRRYVLSSLFPAYAAVASRDRAPTPLARVRRVRTLRDWDRLTVVPRFGFASPEDYYRRAGVASRLDRLRVPALLVAAVDDPMISAAGIAPVVGERRSDLEVRWIRQGGHVSFPAALDFGLGAPYGLEGQVIRWLLARG